MVSADSDLRPRKSAFWITTRAAKSAAWVNFSLMQMWPARRLAVKDLAVRRPLDAREPGVKGEVDALVDEGALDDPGGVGILAVQDVASGVKQRYFRAQAPEGLRQLAADGAGADDGQTPRKLGQFEHGLVGEKARLGETWDHRVARAGARRDDGLLEAECRAVDLDRVGPGEAPVAEEDVRSEEHTSSLQSPLPLL